MFGDLRQGWYTNWQDKGRTLRALIRRLETSNSILSGRNVYHHLIPGDDEAPAAWTIEDDIYFNSARLPSPDTSEDVIFVTGVNNHELGHVLFTPRPDDIRDLYPGPVNEMMREFESNELYRHVWNILEDQRMEMLLFKRYSNQKPYLLAAFTRIVLKGATKEDISRAYILARGRRYLPVHIRRMLKKRFTKPALIPDIRRIIDSYVKLNLLRPSGMRDAHVLVMELVKLLEDNEIWPKNEMPKHEGCNHQEQVLERLRVYRVGGDGSSSGQVDRDEIDKQLKRVAKQIDDENNSKPQQDQPEDPNDADDADDQDQDNPTGATGSDPDAPEGGKGGKGKDADSTDAEDDDSGDDGDSAMGGSGGGNPSSQSAAAGAGPSPIGVSDQLIDQALREAIEEAMEEHNTGEELKEVFHFLKTDPTIDMEKVDKRVDVPEELPQTARHIEKALRLLEADTDPSWERGTTSGKLNVQHVMMHPNDRDHAFDRWQEGGTSGVDQEWVVALDCSGSMMSHFGTLARAAWSMKRAADLVQVKMTILLYGSEGNDQVLYAPNQRASATEMFLIHDLGGTEPAGVLLEAYRLFSLSKRAEKSLLIMTDGSWHPQTTGIDGLNTPEEIIDGLNVNGVHTHLLHLSSWGSSRVNAHRCKTASNFSKVEELPLLMRELISGRMKVKR